MPKHRKGCFGDSPQPIEVQAKEDYSDHQDSEQHVVGTRHRYWRRGERLIQEHRPHDSRIVVQRHGAFENAYDCESNLPSPVSIDQPLEDVELADGLREWWKAC